jgi:hypothetical protein
MVEGQEITCGYYLGLVRSAFLSEGGSVPFRVEEQEIVFVKSIISYRRRDTIPCVWWARRLPLGRESSISEGGTTFLQGWGAPDLYTLIDLLFYGTLIKAACHNHSQ